MDLCAFVFPLAGCRRHHVPRFASCCTFALVQLKAQLEQKLAKFEKPPVTKTPKRAESQMHLRTLLKQTEKLKSQLAKHRPSLVTDA